MVKNMVCLITDGNEKIRKFETIEKAERYMIKHEGVYFLVELLNEFLGVSVIKSANGEVIKIKDLTISRSS